MSDNRDISPEKYLKDPFKKYYEEHPDQLSYKLSDQYDCTTESLIFVVFFIVIVVVALLVGICL
jgi:hypothetical protein